MISFMVPTKPDWSGLVLSTQNLSYNSEFVHLPSWYRPPVRISGQCESLPAQNLGMFHWRRELTDPQPSWSEHSQKCHIQRAYSSLSSTDWRGSNGSLCKAWRTTERSQDGMRHGLWGFNLHTPLRNLIIRSCSPPICHPHGHDLLL